MRTTESDFPEPDLGLDDVRLGTLAGDIRDAMLTRFRHTPKPWQAMSEQQQTECGHAFDQAARDMVRAVVRTLTGFDFPRVVVRIGDVQFKGGEKPSIVGKITADNTKDYRDIMGDAPGSQAVLLFVDSENFLGARGPVAVDRDEPPLPFDGDDGDGIKIEGGSALAISTAVAAAAKDHPPADPSAWTEDEVAALAEAACALAPDADPDAVGDAVHAYVTGADTTDAPSDDELAAMIERDRRAILSTAARTILESYDPDGEVFTDGEVRQMAEAEIESVTLVPPAEIDELVTAIRAELRAQAGETQPLGDAAPDPSFEGVLTTDESSEVPGTVEEGGTGTALPEATPETAGEERTDPGAMPESTPEHPEGGDMGGAAIMPEDDFEASPEELERQRTRQRLKAAEEGGTTEPEDKPKRGRKPKANAEA